MSFHSSLLLLLLLFSPEIDNTPFTRPTTTTTTTNWDEWKTFWKKEMLFILLSHKHTHTYRETQRCKDKFSNNKSNKTTNWRPFNLNNAIFCFAKEKINSKEKLLKERLHALLFTSGNAAGSGQRQQQQKGAETVEVGAEAAETDTMGTVSPGDNTEEGSGSRKEEQWERGTTATTVAKATEE